jgi:hypothetical protein
MCRVEVLFSEFRSAMWDSDALRKTQAVININVVGKPLDK